MIMRNMLKQIVAFTLVELLVVIALISVLSAFSLFALASTGSKAHRLTCINNLKQVGLAFRTWSAVHDGHTPMTMAQAQGGDAEDVGVRILATDQATSRGVSKIFLCMSNELRTPKTLFCPAEYESTYRVAATNFSGVAAPGTVPYINDLNVSYFIGVDAQETSPRMFLTGDHNLGGDANPPVTAYSYMRDQTTTAGIGFAVWMGTNFNAARGPAFMANQHDQQGNVGLADGSVECFNRSRFQYGLRNSGDTVRPDEAIFVEPTGTTRNPGIGANRIQLP
jgi:prepilin-type N-terminal cleavage/methylation domain-containing protein/prepilin-type processing-associated H-X9-DG protein